MKYLRRILAAALLAGLLLGCVPATDSLSITVPKIGKADCGILVQGDEVMVIDCGEAENSGEIRKREERKDRLHQNYLKRKASGAQKRYENKIKDKRKAEIEAKKAAIRAEDIAKGVFVPVSSLPQREPQKGTQIA